MPKSICPSQSRDTRESMCAAAAAGCTFAAAVAGAARREVPVVDLDVVGEADDVLDAAAGGEHTVSCMFPAGEHIAKLDR